jgi:GNAT superfamily N-acetyltransferase
MTQHTAPAATSETLTGLGALVTVRPAGADDTWLLADLFYHLSPQSRHLRYFQPVPLSLANAWAEGRRMSKRPEAHGLTLIATVQRAKHAEAVGVAELVRDPRAPTRGELAVVVRDDQQGRGIGTTLLGRLVMEAQAWSITELHADLLPENHTALRLLRRLPVPTLTTFDAGTLHVVLQLRLRLPDAA